MSQVWQYQVTECNERVDSLQSEVAKCAAAGWELVSTCPKGGGMTAKVLLFWRRPMTQRE
jgi:hypothetical protein